MFRRFNSARELARILADPLARVTATYSIRAYDRLPAASCPCCGYQGKFAPVGITMVRIGGLCPRCRSYERHRLLALAFQRGVVSLAGKDVLHFGPAPIVREMVDRERPKSHVTADIDGARADRVLDLERIELPDASFDVVLASHVLEHVDDAKALAEINRILRSDGLLIAMVPLIEGWEETHEDPSITSREARQIYYQRFDHVRLYGADFRDRVRSAGFALDEFTAGPHDTVNHRLIAGEKVFLCSKSDAARPGN